MGSGGCHRPPRHDRDPHFRGFTFRRNCVQGMRPDAKRNTDNATSLLPSLIRLKQLKGYSYASAIAKEAAGDVDFVRRKVTEAEAG